MANESNESNQAMEDLPQFNKNNPLQSESDVMEAFAEYQSTIENDY